MPRKQIPDRLVVVVHRNEGPAAVGIRVSALRRSPVVFGHEIHAEGTEHLAVGPLNLYQEDEVVDTSGPGPRAVGESPASASSLRDDARAIASAGQAASLNVR